MRYLSYLTLLAVTCCVTGCLAETEPLDHIACQQDRDCRDPNTRCVSGYCLIQSGTPLPTPCEYLTDCLRGCTSGAEELTCDMFTGQCADCVLNTSCTNHCQALQDGATWACNNQCNSITSDPCTLCISTCVTNSDYDTCRDEVCAEVCQSTDACTQCIQDCQGDNQCISQCDSLCEDA